MIPVIINSGFSIFRTDHDSLDIKPPQPHSHGGSSGSKRDKHKHKHKEDRKRDRERPPDKGTFSGLSAPDLHLT